jgi:SAM-dependent methyltransferase
MSATQDDHADRHPGLARRGRGLSAWKRVWSLIILEGNMAQNIYDNPDFFAGYSQLPRQVYGLAGAPEWPAIRAMLPELGGKRVIDLGCGFGWASRWMRKQGAASVLGLDLSQNMIERARADTADAAIKYRVADLETLDLPETAFDLACSALTFHYIRDFGRLVLGTSAAENEPRDERYLISRHENPA